MLKLVYAARHGPSEPANRAELSRHSPGGGRASSTNARCSVACRRAGRFSRAEVARAERPERSNRLQGGGIVAAGRFARRGRCAGTGARPARANSGSRRATAQVLGIAIDAGHCEVIAAGLTGEPHGEPRIVPTPATYAELIAALESAARELMAKPGVVDAGASV